MLTCSHAADVECLDEQMPQIEAVGELRDRLPEGPAEQGVDSTGAPTLTRPDEPAQRQRPSDSTAAQVEGARQRANLTCTWLRIRIHTPDDGGDQAKCEQPQQQYQRPREATPPSSFAVQKVAKEQPNKPGCGTGVRRVVDHAHFGSVRTEITANKTRNELR